MKMMSIENGGVCLFMSPMLMWSIIPFHFLRSVRLLMQRIFPFSAFSMPLIVGMDLNKVSQNGNLRSKAGVKEDGSD